MRLFISLFLILTSVAHANNFMVGIELEQKQQYMSYVEKCKNDIVSGIAVKMVNNERRIDFNTLNCNQWQQLDFTIKNKISGIYSDSYTQEQRSIIEDYRSEAINSVISVLVVDNDN